MDYYKRALELNDETVKNRRYFHTNAETGLHMPMACAYVMDKLTKYGLTPSRCGEGVTATVGNGGKVLLLRADMMPSQCRKKADFHLPARPEKKHMPADMIFTLPCY